MMDHEAGTEMSVCAFQ